MTGHRWKSTHGQPNKPHGVHLNPAAHLSKEWGPPLIYEDAGHWREGWGPAPEGPTSTHALAVERLRHLSDEQRDVLTYAALQGNIFDSRLISTALVCPLAKVLETLSQIEHAGHITKVGPLQFSFPNIVAANAYVGQLTEPQRRGAHLRLASCHQHLDPTQVELLAHHFFCAGEGERALPYLIESGKRAREVQAFWEAHSSLERAVSVLQARGPDGLKQNLEVLLSLAEVDELLGDLDRAGSLCRQVLDSISPDDSVCGRAHALQGWLHFRAGRWEEAGESYDRALLIFSELGDQRLRAQSYLRLGNISFERSRLDEAQEHFEQARDTALASGNVGMLGGIYSNLGVLCSVRGKHEDAANNYIEALHVHLTSDNYNSRLTTIRIPVSGVIGIVDLIPCNIWRLDGYRRSGEETDEADPDREDVGCGCRQGGHGRADGA